MNNDDEKQWAEYIILYLTFRRWADAQTDKLTVETIEWKGFYPLFQLLTLLLLSLCIIVMNPMIVTAKQLILGLRQALRQYYVLFFRLSFRRWINNTENFPLTFVSSASLSFQVSNVNEVMEVSSLSHPVLVKHAVKFSFQRQFHPDFTWITLTPFHLFFLFVLLTSYSFTTSSQVNEQPKLSSS